MKRTSSMLVAFITMIAVTCGVLYVPIRDAQRAAQRCTAQSSFNQLQLALRIYHDEHGSFPPAYLADENGQPMHSWRVLILPYINEEKLYEKYRFGEPWNGPHNIQLADEMPEIFHVCTELESNRFTNVVAVTGPKTAFPGAESTKAEQLADGPENTILLAEIGESDVCWLEPRDLRVEGMTRGVAPAGVLQLSAVEWRDPFVAFADHIKGYAVRSEIPAEDLQALCTIAGGEQITKDQLVERGYLK